MRHLREHDGRREVDLIVERADQKVLAMEVKLVADVNDPDVRHLLWLQERHGLQPSPVRAAPASLTDDPSSGPAPRPPDPRPGLRTRAPACAMEPLRA